MVWISEKKKKVFRTIVKHVLVYVIVQGGWVLDFKVFFIDVLTTVSYPNSSTSTIPSMSVWNFIIKQALNYLGLILYIRVFYFYRVSILSTYNNIRVEEHQKYIIKTSLYNILP